MLINEYMQDGADECSQAVLAIIRAKMNPDWFEHVTVTRFMNCREQGYFLSVRSDPYFPKGKTIAFSRYRSSDDIVVYHVEGVDTFNQPDNFILWPLDDQLFQPNRNVFGYEKFVESADFILNIIESVMDE